MRKFLVTTVAAATILMVGSVRQVHANGINDNIHAALASATQGQVVVQGGYVSPGYAYAPGYTYYPAPAYGYYPSYGYYQPSVSVGFYGGWGRPWYGGYRGWGGGRWRR